jgi:cystathionine beta-lyase/cystathionine gamma-synthase
VTSRPPQGGLRAGGLGPSSRAVHAGERQAATRRPAAVPVHLTAPFLFDSTDDLERAFGPALGDLSTAERHSLYSRYGNPSVRVVEEKLAALEGAEDAVAFASGMGAITGVLSTLLASGDRLLAAADLYGGTLAWLRWLEARHPEVTVERVALGELVTTLEARAGAGEPPTVVYLETPTNPLLDCADLAAVARAADTLGARVVVDSTFATPVLQNPLALGADVVVHSATKYLAGHSDVTAGIAAGSAGLMERVGETRRLGGASLDPHAAFLLARGMKTLTLRVERQCDNAARLARFLADHPAVRRVGYPGLGRGGAYDPVASGQMRAGGAMVAFEVADGAAARRVLDRIGVFQIIPSLGGVESGAILPAMTSHRGLDPAERERLGITGGLIRLSVGIEDGDDLEDDLRRALEGPETETAS